MSVRFMRILPSSRFVAHLKGLRGFDAFAPGSNIRAWMFRILRNTFLTSRTGLRAVVPLSIERQPGLLAQIGNNGATPESQFLQRVNAETLRQAIEQLPVEFREVLLLSDVEEMSHKEIALGALHSHRNGDITSDARASESPQRARA